MNIRRKPDYVKMSFGEYVDLVLIDIERRAGGEEDIFVLTVDFLVVDIAAMIIDAIHKFKPLNLSPQFTGAQVYRILLYNNSVQQVN